MSDTLEYIDSYFNGLLSPEEKVQFENRCSADMNFAEEVAFYISARHNLKAIVHAEKKKHFETLYRSLPPTEKPKAAVVYLLKPLAAVAAAAVVVFFSWQLFFSSPQPATLADQFIHENLSSLGIQMGNGADSLQLALGAFNNKQYDQTETILKRLSNGDQAAEASKYLGILYLTTGRYNEALHQFDKLASYPGLYVNPGLFYKAITLMKRSGPGDVQQAKALLEEVENKKLYGSGHAKEWLKKL